MKIIVNKYEDNKYEFGYYVGKKMNYYIMEKQEVLAYIDKQKPREIITNNLDFKIRGQKAYNIDRLTLKLINISQKHGLKRYIYVKVKEDISFYLYDEFKVVELKKQMLQFKSELITNNPANSIKIFSKYSSLSEMYTTILPANDLSFENIYDGVLKNDYISKELYMIIKNKIEKILLDLKRQYKINDFVFYTNFNNKIKNDFITLNTNVKIYLEKSNKRDNLRTMLYVNGR